MHPTRPFDHLRHVLPEKFARKLLDVLKAQGLQPYSASTLANLQASGLYPRCTVAGGRAFLDRDQFIAFLNNRACTALSF